MPAFKNPESHCNRFKFNIVTNLFNAHIFTIVKVVQCSYQFWIDYLLFDEVSTTLQNIFQFSLKNIIKNQ